MCEDDGAAEPELLGQSGPEQTKVLRDTGDAHSIIL